MERSTRVVLLLAAICMAAICEARPVPESEKYQPETIFPGGAVGGAFPAIPGMPGMPGAGSMFGPLVPGMPGFGSMPGGLNVPVAPGGGFFGGHP